MAGWKSSFFFLGRCLSCLVLFASSVAIPWLPCPLPFMPWVYFLQCYDSTSFLPFSFCRHVA